MRGTIIKGKVRYVTPRYNYMSNKGINHTGGDRILVEIENKEDFELEEKDSVEFELTGNNTAVISKITKKNRLNITLGEALVVAYIGSFSNKYKLDEIQLDRVRLKEDDTTEFVYYIVFHPLGNQYSKYIADVHTSVPMTFDHPKWEEFYDLHKDDETILICEKAITKKFEKYDKISSNVVDAFM